MCYCPVEIIIAIFSTLPPPDIVRARTVSRSWKDIIDASTLLRYIVELHIDRMIDGYDCSANLSERLLALQARRRSWGHPSLAAARRFTFHPGREVRRTLDHGILTRLVDDGNGNLVLAQQDVSDGDKPTGTCMPARAYQNLRPDNNMDGRNLWDIHQNLWILLDPTRPGCVKVNMLGTGNSHPGAAVSKLVVPCPLAMNGDAELRLLGIRGSYFAVNATAPHMNTDQFEYVLVWNWRTGFLASVVPILDSATTRQHGFYFLSEEHFAICTDEYDESDTYSDSAVVMKAYHIPNSNHSNRQHNFSAQHLATFGFPAGHSSQLMLDPTWRHEAMGMAPASIPATFRQAPHQQQFFSDASDSFLLVIPVVLEAGDYDAGEGFFVTHAATVLTHLTPRTLSSSASSTRRTPVSPTTAAPAYVPWEAWGAKGARYVPFGSSRFVAISGERLLRWERLPISEKRNGNRGRSGPMGLVLYDFNQARVRRTQLATANGTISTSRSQATVATKNMLWPPVEDVPSSLIHGSFSSLGISPSASSAKGGAMENEMTLFDADVAGLPCSRMKWALDGMVDSPPTVRDILMDESHILVMLGKWEENTECIAYTL